MWLMFIFLQYYMNHVISKVMMVLFVYRKYADCFARILVDFHTIFILFGIRTKYKCCVGICDVLRFFCCYKKWYFLFFLQINYLSYLCLYMWQQQNMCLTYYSSNMTVLFLDEGCNNIELKNTSLEMKDNELQYIRIDIVTDTTEHEIE